MQHVLDYRLGQLDARPARDSGRTSWGIIRTWYERYSQRRNLLELEDHLLTDIGLTRAEAATEAHKPFWVA